MTTAIENATETVSTGRNLSRGQSAEVFSEIMSGRAGDPQIEHFLAALADKGETADEIVGAAEVMRRHVVSVPCDDPHAVDTCGTGGDGISTFNVSTAAAIVAAGAGARVAKHGNRTNTRKSGSAEVLQALGVNIDASVDVVAQCLREARLAFLFAPRLHPAMKHAAPARRRLGRRTIFNLLGPLTNPAGVRRQVVGVARPDLLNTLADVLRQLGATHALVVHGHDGLCDLTITGLSSTVELRDGRLRHGTVSPTDLGLAIGSLDDLRVSSPSESADAVRAVLAGETGPRRDHTLLNAAAALVVAGQAPDLRDGVQRAADAIDTGAAGRTLDMLITMTGKTR